MGGHRRDAAVAETACSQVGYHVDYTPDELRERYGSPQTYIDPK
jgi:hypothetical protein